jgi:hypothetical protein
MGGFSVANVPRPLPFETSSPWLSVLRLDGFWVAFLSSHDVDFIAFDDTAQLRLGATLQKFFSQHCRHGLDIILVQFQLVGDLAIRQVQPHQVQTHHPNLERLTMMGKHGSRQVIKAALTLVALAVRLIRVETSLLQPVEPTMGAFSPCGCGRRNRRIVS